MADKNKEEKKEEKTEEQKEKEGRELVAGFIATVLFATFSLQLVLLILKENMSSAADWEWIFVLMPAWLMSVLVTSIVLASKAHAIMLRERAEAKPDPLDEFPGIGFPAGNPGPWEAIYHNIPKGWSWNQSWIKGEWDITFNAQRGEWRAINFSKGQMEHFKNPGEAMAWADMAQDYHFGSNKKPPMSGIHANRLDQ